MRASALLDKCSSEPRTVLLVSYSLTSSTPYFSSEETPTRYILNIITPRHSVVKNCMSLDVIIIVIIVHCLRADVTGRDVGLLVIEGRIWSSRCLYHRLATGSAFSLKNSAQTLMECTSLQSPSFTAFLSTVLPMLGWC